MRNISMWWWQAKSARQTLHRHLFCRQSLRFWSKDFWRKSMNVNLCKRKQTRSAFTYINIYIYIYIIFLLANFTSPMFSLWWHLKKKNLSELCMNSVDDVNMSSAPRGDGGESSSTCTSSYWGTKEENKKDPKGSLFLYITTCCQRPAC